MFAVGAFSTHSARVGVLGALCAGAVVLTACGGSSAGTKTSSSVPALVTSSSTSAPSSTSVPASSSVPGKQTLTITPATGLHDKQTVQAAGAGFTSGEALTVVECAAKGAATGPGDCNLAAMQSVTADATGAVSLQLSVLVGPFGSNNIVCSATQACLISMTQASLSPTEEADAPISFAG